MTKKHLHKKKVVVLINQLRSFAPGLTKRILEDHQNNDSELYHALIESVCKFHEDFYELSSMYAERDDTPIPEPIPREQLVTDFISNVAHIERKIEGYLYAALEHIGRFGILKEQTTGDEYLLEGFSRYGKAIMNRTFETSHYKHIQFYSDVNDINEDVYLPFFHIAFEVLKQHHYDWSYISPNRKQFKYDQGAEEHHTYDPTKSLLEDMKRDEDKPVFSEEEQENIEKLHEIFDFMRTEIFGEGEESDEEEQATNQHDVPTIVIGYFDQFQRFPDGYPPED